MKLTEKILIDTIIGYTAYGYFVSNINEDEIIWRYHDYYKDGSYCPGATELNATSIWYQKKGMHQEKRIDAFPMDPRRAQELKERNDALKNID